MLSNYSDEELEKMAEIKKQQETANIANTIENVIANGAAPEQQQQVNAELQQSPSSQPQQQTDKQAVIADILGKIASGYSENRNAGLLDKINQAQQIKQAQANGEEISEQPEQPEKTGWNRFGQTLGTAARVASNPLVQGIAAGAIKGKTSGDWGKGLEYGIQYAQNKATSDQYERMMGRTPSIFGSYGADDYKAQVDAAYKNNRINIENQKAEAYEKNIESQIEQRTEKLKIDKAKLDEQIRHNKAGESAVSARLGISREKAKAYIDHVKWQEKHGGKTAKQNADMANQRFKNAMTYINTLPEGEEKQAAYQEAYQNYIDSITFNEDDDLFEED